MSYFMSLCQAYVKTVDNYKMAQNRYFCSKKSFFCKRGGEEGVKMLFLPSS